MTVRELLPVFSSSSGKIESDICVILYDDCDVVSAEFDSGTALADIENLTSIGLDCYVEHAYWEDGCLFIEVETER